jgi:hypothetical protein
MGATTVMVGATAELGEAAVAELAVKGGGVEVGGTAVVCDGWAAGHAEVSRHSSTMAEINRWWGLRTTT